MLLLSVFRSILIFLFYLFRPLRCIFFVLRDYFRLFFNTIGALLVFNFSFFFFLSFFISILYFVDNFIFFLRLLSIIEKLRLLITLGLFKILFSTFLLLLIIILLIILWLSKIFPSTVFVSHLLFISTTSFIILFIFDSLLSWAFNLFFLRILFLFRRLCFVFVILLSLITSEKSLKVVCNLI